MEIQQEFMQAIYLTQLPATLFERLLLFLGLLSSLSIAVCFLLGRLSKSESDS